MNEGELLKLLALGLIFLSILIIGISIGEYNSIEGEKGICLVEVENNIYKKGVIKYNKCLIDGLYYIKFEVVR